MKKIVLSIATVMSLCLTAGCTAPVDSQDDVETDLGEAQQALSANLPCTVYYVSGALRVKLYNNTGRIITYGHGYYIVSHSNNVPQYQGTFTDVHQLDGAYFSFSAAADPNPSTATTCTSHITYVDGT